MENLNNNINFNNPFANPNFNAADQNANNQRQRPVRSQNRRERQLIRHQILNQFRFKRSIRFIGSWNLNIFFLIINFIMMIAYGLIIHHQHFKDQNFNMDQLLDSDKFPQTYLWVYNYNFFIISFVQAIGFLICHVMFLIIKGYERAFLEWKPAQHNAQQNDNYDHPQGYLYQYSTLEFIFQENYFFSLLIIYVMDRTSIFHTFFEILVFLTVYAIQTLIIASEQLIQTYIKEIIETEISFSSALLLRKNETFQRRIKKVENYYLCLLMSSVVITLFVGWLFYYADFLILSLLAYPGIRNSLKVAQDLQNFKYQVNHALSFVSNDEQIIVKMNFNFVFNFITKLLDICFCCVAYYIGGFSIGVIPMTYRLIVQFYQEIDKWRKFRSFLKNINNDYPLVIFDQNRGEHEECAICKEVMNSARKLPCNHCFHWFCIIQLIESGSKNCPICRGEFNHSRQNNQNNQNNNRGNSIFNFRLGGWLPNISIRMVRNRAPAIPFNQAIDRIREIFPYLSTLQIAQELRQANGHIDQAILNISENAQRGLYGGFN